MKMQRILINMYLTIDQNQGKYEKAAYPTPGATLFSAGTSVIRAMFTEHGVTYALDGNQFFSVNSAGTRTNIGTVNNSTGWAKIRGIQDQLLVVTATAGYVYKITANTWAVISDGNFPTSIQDIECQDEFGLILLTSSQTWQASAISDLTSWPVLAFASTTGNQNFNVAIVSTHRELYLLGNQTSEVWDNLGQTNFTFGRNTSAFIEFGCGAVGSIAKADNSFIFLAQSPTGGNVIMRMTGYSPVKISSSAIDYQISTYATVSDAVAFTYQQEGHEFYVITFPTPAVTWVYDISTQFWHQRQSLIAAAQTQWLAGSYTFNYNKCLVGDTNTGNIYQLDMTNNTENTAAITRTLVTHPMYASGAWLYLDKLQVDFDNGAGASLSNWNLYISRDGGRTFGSAKAAVPQVDANGMYRVYWVRNGSARAFVFKNLY